MNKRPYRNPNRAIPLTLAEIAEAQALAARGVFVDAIAEALSSTVDAVNDALAGKVGAPLGVADGPLPRRVALTPREIATIGRRVAHDAALADIAAEFSITPAKADWAARQYRRGLAHAEARRRMLADNWRTQEIARREVEDAPASEPRMADLLRTPLTAKSGPH